jgi:hypothetical protein
LVVDPMQPFRRVTEVRVGIGAPWKVIRVQPVLRELLGISSEPIKKLPAGRKAAAETKVIVPEESSPKLAIMQNAEPDDANAKRLIEKKMKLLDEVISVLIESVRGKAVDAIEEEGWIADRRQRCRGDTEESSESFSCSDTRFTTAESSALQYR